MYDLIEGLLELSRIQRQEIQRQQVDLSQLVEGLFDEMRERFPDQQMATHCDENCKVLADERMLYSALENLINNAWKYSSKAINPKVEFGVLPESAKIPKGVGNVPKKRKAGQHIYYLKDNGSGFDMKLAGSLFNSFERLHADSQFEGTGIGLATARRIIEKHSGNIWASAEPNKGATFYFMLGN